MITRNKMNTKIGNIATIHSGVYAKAEYQADVYYIQVRQYNNKHEFVANAIPELKMEGKIAKHLLKPGDVLIVAKGNDNFAVEWMNQVNPAVASSTFIVVRPNLSKVTPQYLNWFLNLPDSQTYFQNHSKGTSIASITKDIVGSMEIPLPPIKQQETITQLYSLRRLEKSITKQLDELKDTYLQNLVLTAIQ